MFDILGGTRETFGLVFVSDGQNEGPLNNGPDIIAQLVHLLCGIISVCYIWWQRWDSVVSSPIQRDNPVTREDRSLTRYSVRLPEISGANILATELLYKVEATRKVNQWSESALLRMLPGNLTGQALAAYHKSVVIVTQHCHTCKCTMYKSSTENENPTNMQRENKLPHFSSPPGHEYNLFLGRCLWVKNWNIIQCNYLVAV